MTMTSLKDVSHHSIHVDPELCVNQIATRVLRNGELVAVFNQERFPFHHDSGRTLLMRSKDGGVTWQPDPPQVVLDWSDTVGNWDCGICELADGTLLVNLTITVAIHEAAFQRVDQTVTVGVRCNEQIVS